MPYLNLPSRQRQSPKPPTPRQIALIKKLYLSSCFPADEVAELDEWLVRATRREVSEKIDEAKARIAAHKPSAPLPDRLDSLTRRVAYQVDKHTSQPEQAVSRIGNLADSIEAMFPSDEEDRP